LGGVDMFDGSTAHISTLQTSVFSILRDIDLVGWYDDGSTIGILCREIGVDSVAASRAIVTRIQDALAKNLDSAQAQSLSIAWHLFSGAGRKGKKSDVVRSVVESEEIELQRSRPRDLRPPEAVSHLGVARQELS